MAHPVDLAIARAELEAQLSTERALDSREHLRNLTELHAVAPSDAAEHGGTVPPAERDGAPPGPGAGFALQYAVVGVVSAAIPSAMYGFMLGYLAVPGYVYSAAVVTLSLPWSFKFAAGLLSDTCPIRGRRRKPYMAIGWALCALALLNLAGTRIPPPYWCVAPDGQYIRTRADELRWAARGGGRAAAAEQPAAPPAAEGARAAAAAPCNPDAPSHAGQYTALLLLAAVGYVLADVAADGLLVEWARREPEHRRGALQVRVYTVRTLGNAAGAVLVGLGFNSYEYNGSFSWGLSLRGLALVLAALAALMVPATLLSVREPRRARGGGGDGSGAASLGEYGRQTWALLRSRAFLAVILYQLGTTGIGGVASPAGPLVKEVWAGVRTLQNAAFSCAGALLFAAGLQLVRARLLHASWRRMLAGTTLVLVGVDSVFTALTISGVVRNQYFYLGEVALVELPAAANFMAGNFVVVEMASDGNEGLVYGVLTTAYNLGHPVCTALGNQIFAGWRPSLSDVSNFIEDTDRFRALVGWSYALAYGFGLGALLLLPLLPDQKAECRRRLREWPASTPTALLAVGLLALALAYALSVDWLTLRPETSCLRLAGGAGC